MKFDCILCNQRKSFTLESDIANVCYDCRRQYPNLNITQEERPRAIMFCSTSLNLSMADESLLDRMIVYKIPKVQNHIKGSRTNNGHEEQNEKCHDERD